MEFVFPSLPAGPQLQAGACILNQPQLIQTDSGSSTGYHSSHLLKLIQTLSTSSYQTHPDIINLILSNSSKLSTLFSQTHPDIINLIFSNSSRPYQFQSLKLCPISPIKFCILLLSCMWQYFTMDRCFFF